MSAKAKWVWDKESSRISFSVWSIGVYSGDRDMPTYVLRERKDNGHTKLRYSTNFELLIKTAEEVERLRALEQQELEKLNNGFDFTIIDVMAERLRLFAEGGE